MIIRNPQDHVFLVTAFSNTEIKQEILHKCIDNLRTFGIEIILCSHFPETQDIQEKVNYYLYDAHNPVLNHEEYNKFNLSNSYFFENEDIRVDKIQARTHDFAVFTLLKNGTYFAQTLNKKYIHVVNYDCIPDPHDFYSKFLLPIETHDVCYCIWDENITHLVATYIISFQSNALNSLFSKYQNISDYYLNRESGWQIEQTICQHIKSANLNVYNTQFDSKNCNLISEFHQGLDVAQAFTCVNEQQKTFFFVQNKTHPKFLNVRYLDFNEFFRLEPGESKLIPIGDYTQNQNVYVYSEGQEVYVERLNQPFETFITLAKVHQKTSLQSLIDKAYKLGMSQNQEEISQFAAIISKLNPKNFLEIGTDRGGTFYLWSQLSQKNGKKISIDLPFGKFGHINYDLEKRNSILRECQNVHLIEGSSHDIPNVEKVKEILGEEKLDFLFIDGDHSESGVLKDFELYKGFVRDGGIIAFHDIKDSQNHISQSCFVHEAWSKISGDKHEIKSLDDWGGIGYINFITETNNPIININFIDGAFCEVLSPEKQTYDIIFKDPDTNSIVHQQEINNNCWVKTARKYFTNYEITIKHTETSKLYTYHYNPTNQKVYIHLDSKSLGDTIAWFPYVEEFRKKHSCHLVCSTFWNNLFQSEYPDIQFVKPSSEVKPLYAMYQIGIFHDTAREVFNYKTIPLQKIASSILGLEHKELKPKIRIKNPGKPDKYIAISTTSTCQAKYWNLNGGWQGLVDYFNKKGFKVVVLQKESTTLKNVITPNCNDINDTISWLTKCRFFVGLSSGVSWLAWALNIPVVMISGFTDPFNEFECIRITPTEGICHGCWHKHDFDKSDWSWCPEHKGTPKMYECSKTIGLDQVIQVVNPML